MRDHSSPTSLLLLLVFCTSAARAVAGQDPDVADELDEVLAAQTQNERQLESALGVAKLEVWEQHSKDEVPILTRSAAVEVYYDRLGKARPFDRPRYNVRLDVQREMVRTKRGGQAARLANWGPEKRVLIHDGRQLFVVRFSDRFHPTGCTGDIYPADEAYLAGQKAGLPFWQDPARLWRDCLDLGLLIKNRSRESISMSRTTNPDGFVGKYPAAEPYAEFQVESDQGNQVTSHRIYNPTKQKAPVQSYDLTWAQKSGVWYVKSLTQIWDNREVEKESGFHRKSVISFESFEVNVPVEQSLFRLGSHQIPVGTRFMNRSKNAETQYLFFDGEQLGKKRIAPERN